MEPQKYIAVSSAFLNRFLRLRQYWVFYLALLLSLSLSSLFYQPAEKVDVDVLLRAERNDTFQFFYLPVGQPWYGEKESVKRPVAGSKDYQHVGFRIPADQIMQSVRFDLGTNPGQQKIYIKKIILSYGSDSLLLFKPGVFNKFACNEFVDQEDSVFVLSSKPGLQYDPYITSGEIVLEYGDLTYNRTKWPILVLLPWILALLFYLFFRVRYADFMSAFYTFGSVFFVLLLLSPVLNNAFGFYKDENHEKRILARNPGLPEGDLGAYPRKFEDYFNDNFGYRSLLVKRAGTFKYKVFSTSSIPDAVIGREGWMFLNSPFCYEPKANQIGTLLPDSTLESIVRSWEDRKHKLERDSIKFYKAFWPDKHTVYPEYLPAQLRPFIADSSSRLLQVMRYLRQKGSDLNILNLTDTLLMEKKKHLLYLKHDSHWNERGAFIAYTALMNRIAKDFPQLKPFPESDFSISEKVIHGGEISNMIGIDDTEIVPEFKFKRRGIPSKEVSHDGYPPSTFVYENRSAATDLTLLVFRDSFTTPLVPLYNLHFKKVVLIWLQPLTDELIARVQPDIVIEGNVSRFIAFQH